MAWHGMGHYITFGVCGNSDFGCVTDFKTLNTTPRVAKKSLYT
jgi:hypothetical protein